MLLLLLLVGTASATNNARRNETCSASDAVNTVSPVTRATYGWNQPRHVDAILERLAAAPDTMAL
jgi:hypothetical protein